MPKSLQEHANNRDLRHPDVNDDDYLYDVYEVMRERGPFAHTDVPFLAMNEGGAWVSVRYDECRRLLQDWKHISGAPAAGVADFVLGDLLITVHRCLGSDLARLEFAVGLQRLHSRIPDCVAATDEPAAFHGDVTTRGYASVPVIFTPGVWAA